MDMNRSRLPARLKGAIKTLPPKQAAYLTLWLNNWSYQDIAIAFDLRSRSSVGIVIRRAKEKLKGMVNK